MRYLENRMFGRSWFLCSARDLELEGMQGV